MLKPELITRISDLPNPRYIRRGKCNRCGFCCEWRTCELLSYDGDGLAVCPVHGTDEQYPECVVFPEAPPILTTKCGYYFLDTWEDNRKVKHGNDL